jgi:hypothetical protein
MSFVDVDLLIEAGPPQHISPQDIEKEDCNSGL